MKRAYAALMILYPAGYRALFSREMAAVFEEARRDSRRLGWRCYVLFLVSELAGLLRGAAEVRGIEWSRQRKFPRSLSFSAGAVLSLGILRMFLGWHALPALQFRGLAHDDAFELLALATISVVLIAGFSLAFVLNVRSVARRRSGRA